MLTLLVTVTRSVLIQTDLVNVLAGVGTNLTVAVTRYVSVRGFTHKCIVLCVEKEKENTHFL